MRKPYRVCEETLKRVISAKALAASFALDLEERDVPEGRSKEGGALLR